MLIKICGITDQEIAKKLVSLPVDMLGLVFVKTSPRYVSIEQALKIQKIVDNSIEIVAVFQDQPLIEIKQIVELLRPDYVQLHGQEDPAFCKAVRVPIIKAIRLGRTIKETKKLLDDYRSVCRYFLIDRKVQGTGPLVNLTQLSKLAASYPLLLSGGLNSSNITQILNFIDDSVRGVDVSGGVEDSPGHKSNKKVSTFVKRVRNYYA
jgi:phosphoribosylanthranilate isomerase